MKKLFTSKNAFAAARIVLCAAFLVVLALSSVESMPQKSLCFFYNMTGRECPGCGGTRACVEFMHFNFRDAYTFNPIAAAFFMPSLILLFADDLSCLIRRLAGRSKCESAVEYILYGTFLKGRAEK